MPKKYSAGSSSRKGRVAAAYRVAKQMASSPSVRRVTSKIAGSIVGRFARAMRRAGGPPSRPQGKFRRMYERPDKKNSEGDIYRTKGMYKGLFPAKGRADLSIRKYERTGAVNTHEVVGTCSDPDTVYLSVHSHQPTKLLEAVCQALGRKLMYKLVGIDITNVNKEIPGFDFDESSNSYIVKFIEINQSTGLETVGYTRTSTSGDTLKIWTDSWRGYLFPFCGGFGAGSASNAKRVRYLQLYRYDDNGLTPVHQFFIGQLNLEEEMCELWASCDVKVQNRTLSATGSEGIETVSNAPLEGKLLEFNATPKVRVDGPERLGCVTANGMLLLRAQDIATLYPGKEPPLKTVFSNCKKISNVKLDPGDIKRFIVTTKIRRSFNKILEWMYLQYDPNSDYYLLPGHHKIIALEDMVNVNLLQNISIAYECNFRHCAMFVTKPKRGVMAGDFTTQPVSL